MRSPIFRQYFSTTSSRVIFKCSASRPISTSLIHTYPGAPVQQLPHWVQLKLSPSRYHRSESAWRTFSVIAVPDRMIAAPVGKSNSNPITDRPVGRRGPQTRFIAFGDPTTCRPTPVFDQRTAVFMNAFSRLVLARLVPLMMSASSAHTTSVPPPPLSLSAPAPPIRVSLPLPPLIVSLPSPPHSSPAISSPPAI